MISLSLLSVLSVNSLVIVEAVDVTEENSDQLDENEGYITGYIDENGEIQYMYTSFYAEDRSVGAVVKEVAVYVGKLLVEYVKAVVIDGIIVEVTVKSGTEWTQIAINSLLNQPYRGSLYLACDIYPPNSYRGATCRSN